MPVRLILYAALFASTFVYVLVLFVVKVDVVDPPPPILPMVLGVVALSVAVVSFVLPGITLKTAVRNLGLATRPAPNFGDQPAGTLVFEDPAEARRRAAPALQTAMILRLALRESIALFGLVVGMLGYGLVAASPFFVASWILFAIAFPSQASLDRELENASGAKLGAG